MFLSNFNFALFVLKQQRCHLFRFDKDNNYHYEIEETVQPNTDKAILTTLGCRSNTENPRVQYFIVDSKGDLKSHQAGAFSIYEFQDYGRYMVNVSVAQPLDYEKQKDYTLTLRCQVFNNFSGAFFYI